jgi:GNAT superfamily N-acetyltransferase
VSQIEVRAAEPEDLVALLALYAELTDGTPSAAPGDPETSRTVLKHVLTQADRHLLVAVLDGRVVGTADLAIVPNITHRGTPWGIIENVVVAGAARRRGAARALFGEIERLASAAGCHKVSLLSGKARAEAHSFYRSVGYEPVCEGFKLYLDRPHQPSPPA